MISKFDLFRVVRRNGVSFRTHLTSLDGACRVVKDERPLRLRVEGYTDSTRTWVLVSCRRRR